MGLYIIGGKTPKNDRAEIVTMNGVDVFNSIVPALIFRDIL